MDRKPVGCRDSFVFSLKSAPRRGRQVHIMPMSTSTVLVLNGRVRIGEKLRGRGEGYVLDNVDRQEGVSNVHDVDLEAEYAAQKTRHHTSMRQLT